MLARVSKIMEQLVHAWDVLATMTPPEYSAIRPYARVEQRLPELAVPAASNSCSATRTRRCSSRTRTGPTCSREVRGGAARAVALRRGAAPARAARPAGAGRATLERDWTQPYVAERRRRAGLARRSTATRAHWDLYQLGEELTDLEDTFRLWRFRHVTTVERIIGFKRGTGGTGGVSYLRKMLDVVLFPEIWKLRTDL